MAAARIVKKVGKENAPPARTKKAVEEDAADMGDMDDMDDARKARATKAKPARAEEPEEGVASASGSSASQRRIDALTTERDRFRSQRDAFSKQFDELSNLRETEAEKLLGTYKEKAEARATAQSSVITSLTTLNESLQARIEALEKAAAAATKNASAPGDVFEGSGAPAAMPAKADPKEIRALKDRLTKVEGAYRKKADELEQLDKLYKAEVDESRKLLASRSGAPGASAAVGAAVDAGDTKEDAAKDSASLRLYEDMFDLAITNVTLKPGKYGPKDKEYTFTCVQTAGRRSISFKLRAYLMLDQDLVAAKAKNPYVHMIEYTPNLLGETDAAFLEHLGPFAEAFTAPRSELPTMFETLRGNMAEVAEE